MTEEMVIAWGEAIVLLANLLLAQRLARWIGRRDSERARPKGT